MTKNYVLSIALLLTSLSNAQDCLTEMPENLKVGILAYYPFSDGSTNDFSGNGHHLANTSAAAATADRNGNENCSYSFSNPTQTTNQELRCTDTAFLNSLGAFSISCWYNITGGNQGLHRSMVSRDYAPSCPDRSGQWSVGAYDGHRAVFGRNQSVWQDWQPGSVFTDVWQQVTATYNQTGQTVKIYINGVLQDTATGTAGCGTPVVVNDIGDLFIGKRFTGKIDDVFIYNRELTAAETVQLYNLGSCCTATILASNANDAATFVLSPNPVKSNLMLSGAEDLIIRSMQIYNTLGQLVFDVPEAKNARTLNVSSLSEGNYVIKIQSDKGAATIKFIKK